MHCTSTSEAFRFVWRAADSPRWKSTRVRAPTPKIAIDEFQKHLERKLKRALADVVVDHVFRRGEPEDADEQLSLLTPPPLSLTAFEHPFHFEFDNTVRAPGFRPNA